MTTLRVPVSTYRLQFNRGFRFADARTLVPYLQMLGITDLYASPILQARSGTTHGYDVTDPTRLNPELGTAQEFQALVEEIKYYGMGLLLDIVPNHMAASPENPWWMDVLENGPSSRYAAYFDIDWRLAKKLMQGKVLLPILCGPYRNELENGNLTLVLDENGFYVRYHEVRLPLELMSCQRILAHRISTFEEALGKSHPAFQALIDLVDAIKKLAGGRTADPERVEERRRAKETIKRRLWQLYSAHPEIKTFLDDNLRIFNGANEDPSSFDLLDRLLADQAYRLGFWRVAREGMNYRRFFDISDLIGVRVEDPRVFEATHALIFELIKAGNVTGLRADHIDGLYDPVGYLRRLQSCIAPEAKERGGSPGFYVLVEKILIGDETLPQNWPVYGTTGYEFSNTVNGVFVNVKGIKLLDAIYANFTGSGVAFKDVAYQQKKRVMEELFMGEVRTLGHHLDLLADQHRHAREISSKDRLQALVEVTACLPVYRAYTRGFAVPPRDRSIIERAIEEAMQRKPALGIPPFEFLRRVLLLDFPTSLRAAPRKEWLGFVRRWQQFTGSIMAKGLEDTSLYVYNRLISLNEVGGDPEAQTLSVEAFHRRNQDRATHSPFSMNATSTHDTKRSEDVRSRINVLSELPQAWAKYLDRWSRWNRAKKQRVNGRSVPDPNEEILLYQTLMGAWPLHKDEVPAFGKRLRAYVVKAAREAKVHTSWIDPDPEHECALMAFVDSILRGSDRDKFLTDFLRFQKKIAFYAAFNALAQVLLKIASPGVPDFYQGTELWDFSLVDPDNRRPVDFEKRVRLLEDLKRREAEDLLAFVSELLTCWEDGRIKLFVTSKALGFRTDHRELFFVGDYLPLFALGRRKEHVCAFARRKQRCWALVAVPRILTKLVSERALPLGQRVWGNSRLVLPGNAPGRWLNVLTGETLQVSSAKDKKILPLKSVFSHFPIALLSGVRA